MRSNVKRVAGATRAATASCVAVALVGCATPSTETQRETIPSPPSLALTLGGLGFVNGSTRFDAREVRALLPGYDVELAAFAASEAGAVELPVIIVSREGATLAELFGGDNGRVARIDVVSPDVEGPYGGRVGATLARSRAPNLRCTAGETDLGGNAVCAPGTDQRIVYLYDYRGDAPATSTQPTAKQLRAARLARMVWTSPST